MKTIPERYAEAAEEASHEVYRLSLTDGLDPLAEEVGRHYAALAAEHEALAEATRWRDVNVEPLPEPEGETFLVQLAPVRAIREQGYEFYGGSPVSVTVWDHKLKTTLNGHRVYREDVSHWMPLPPAPTQPPSTKETTP